VVRQPGDDELVERSVAQRRFRQLRGVPRCRACSPGLAHGRLYASSVSQSVCISVIRSVSSLVLTLLTSGVGQAELALVYITRDDNIVLHVTGAGLTVHSR